MKKSLLELRNGHSGTDINVFSGKTVCHDCVTHPKVV